MNPSASQEITTGSSIQNQKFVLSKPLIDYNSDTIVGGQYYNINRQKDYDSEDQEFEQDDSYTSRRFGPDYGSKRTVVDLMQSLLGLENNLRALINESKVIFDDEVIRKTSTKYTGRPGRVLKVNYNNTILTSNVIPSIFILNKPKGCITAVVDKNHTTVMKYLYECPEYSPIVHSKVFPVGRLDLNTTGLLLFTNDGALHTALISRETHVFKTYRCVLENSPSDDDALAFFNGVSIPLPRGKSRNCLSAKMEILDKNLADLTIREGAHHQVKRMWLGQNNRVLELSRHRFGPIEVDVEEGKMRLLNLKESLMLYKSVNLENSFFAKSLR